ncbi:hypothetical protein BG003_009718 [Podila horticola]|nr:hypothetical protein BG003_009718 [Podila horticola]
MTSLKLECLTTDGTYLYGFSQPNYPGYSTRSSVIALIRSNPNPSSAATLTWTLLNAIDGSDHVYLKGGQQCTIDDKGVFSVFSPGCQKTKNYYGPDSLGPKGLQFTPGNSNPKNDTQGSMPGTWTTFNLTGYKHRWQTYATNAVFNVKDSTGVNTLMHAVINATYYENMFLSAMNPGKTVLAQDQQSFKLDPNTSGDGYMSLGYANGNLYVFGSGWHTVSQSQVNAMTIIPITSTTTFIPNNRIYTTLNATVTYSSCNSLVAYQNANLGKDLNLKEKQAYFFYYDGTSIRELGSSENTDIVEINTMVPLGTNTSFEIYMVPNSVTNVINSMRLTNDGTPRRNITRTSATSITIPDRFTMVQPSPTPTKPGSSSNGGDGDGLGAGAIIGILAAVLVALGGLVVLVRRRKVSAQNAAVMTAQTQIRPHYQEIRPTHEIKSFSATGPDGQHPATSIQGGPTTLAGQSSFAQQQQQQHIYPAYSQQQQAYPLAYSQPQPQPQPYQPPQQQFVFSAHPRPSVVSVMNPDNPILQQEPELQPQARHYSQVSQDWQPRPFVPPN